MTSRAPKARSKPAGSKPAPPPGFGDAPRWLVLEAGEGAPFHQEEDARRRQRDLEAAGVPAVLAAIVLGPGGTTPDAPALVLSDQDLDGFWNLQGLVHFDPNEAFWDPKAIRRTLEEDAAVAREAERLRRQAEARAAQVRRHLDHLAAMFVGAAPPSAQDEPLAWAAWVERAHARAGLPARCRGPNLHQLRGATCALCGAVLRREQEPR